MFLVSSIAGSPIASIPIAGNSGVAGNLVEAIASLQAKSRSVNAGVIRLTFNYNICDTVYRISCGNKRFRIEDYWKSRTYVLNTGEIVNENDLSLVPIVADVDIEAVLNTIHNLEDLIDITEEEDHSSTLVYNFSPCDIVYKVNCGRRQYKIEEYWNNGTYVLNTGEIVSEDALSDTPTETSIDTDTILRKIHDIEDLLNV